MSERIKRQKSKPKNELMPFITELGPRMGSGQDNVVFRMDLSPAPPATRHQPSGSVLKINHRTVGEHRIRYADERKAAMSGLQYKKNKYDLLKLFLGEFVPDTSFVLGKVKEGNDERYAEYTVQQEVPRVSMSDLTEEQRHDPRLIANTTKLMKRLQWMYSVLGQVNASIPQGVKLDAKVDLGGVSDFVASESIDHVFDENDANTVIGQNTSPNLLVDPNTMMIACIDFDQGQWTPGMAEAKELVFQTVHARNNSRDVGSIALAG